MHPEPRKLQVIEEVLKVQSQALLIKLASLLKRKNTEVMRFRNRLHRA
jgi:hypothetical protein